MRVIAGQFRSRRLKSVPGLAVRPTPDRLRESLFSILAPHIEGRSFVDAYAGSGSVGIEALSRGAKHVTFIERNVRALAVLRENIEALGIRENIEILRGGVSALLADHPADIVFLDPPYDQISEYRNALLAITGSTLVIAQHASRLLLEDKYGSLLRTRIVKQGDNALSFYEPAP